MTFLLPAKRQKVRPIDKSALTFGEPLRIRDRKWLDAHEHFECMACGRPGDGSVVAAHIRAGHEAGGSQKPSDDLVVPLCASCHADQERNPGPMWWLNAILKPLMRRRYTNWKAGLL
jgi:hypothetical protein